MDESPAAETTEQPSKSPDVKQKKERKQREDRPKEQKFKPVYRVKEPKEETGPTDTNTAKVVEAVVAAQAV